MWLLCYFIVYVPYFKKQLNQNIELRALILIENFNSISLGKRKNWVLVKKKNFANRGDFMGNIMSNINLHQSLAFRYSLIW